MRNFKIILQYEGTRYQGWQRQDSTGNTIQGKLEAILGKMTGLGFVQVDGSGRTDSGVHALGQVANFKIDTEMTKEQVMDYINQYLPEDIGVISIAEMPERFHSRLNAKGKTYRYRIWNSPLPCVFERKYVHVVAEKLDVNAMKKAAACFVGKHDFKAFTSNKKSKKSTVRTIESIAIERNGNGSPNFDVKLLPDAQTSEEVMNSIEQLFNGNADTSLLYFSGHGFVNTIGAEIVMPQDIINRGSYYKGLQMKDIMEVVNNLV